MAIKRKASFDPKSFLAMVGEGRSIGKYGKDWVVYSQERMRFSTSRKAR
jgi:hypothetical protein